MVTRCIGRWVHYMPSQYAVWQSLCVVIACWSILICNEVSSFFFSFFGQGILDWGVFYLKMHMLDWTDYHTDRWDGSGLICLFKNPQWWGGIPASVAHPSRTLCAERIFNSKKWKLVQGGDIVSRWNPCPCITHTTVPQTNLLDEGVKMFKYTGIYSCQIAYVPFWAYKRPITSHFCQD